MRLIRVSISLIALALGVLVVQATGASAVSPCAPGRPPGRPPGQPPGETGQPPGRPPQYPPGRCQLALSATSAKVGSKVAASGDGFQPSSTAALQMGSTTVGSAVADSQGRISQEFTVPAGTAPGQYDVFATGLGADGTPYELTATIEILPSTAAGSVLSPASGAARRSGAGLAAAPQVGGIGRVVLPVAGGGVATGAGTETAPAGPLVDGVGSIGEQVPTALPGATGAAVVPEPVVVGAAVSGPASSGGLNPLLAVGGGLALVGLGAGAAIAAKRRKPSKP